MGKLWDGLQRQLKTERAADAEKCIKVYEAIKERSGGKVWASDWDALVRTEWAGRYPNSHRVSSLNALGQVFYEGLTKSE